MNPSSSPELNEHARRDFVITHMYYRHKILIMGHFSNLYEPIRADYQTFVVITLKFELCGSTIE